MAVQKHPLHTSVDDSNGALMPWSVRSDEAEGGKQKNQTGGM
jgi:hypothetical protein